MKKNDLDYKLEFNLETADQKSECAKDFAAFSNYGGGYILIGVRQNEKELILENINKKYDPADISNKIEKYFSEIPQFEILYFTYELEGSIVTLGIIYIYPSKSIITIARTIQDQNGTIEIGSIFYRRNTKSVITNTSEITDINSRIFNSKNIKNLKHTNHFALYFKFEKHVILRVYDVIDAKFEWNAKNIGIKLQIAWYFYSKASKFEFAQQIGISIEEIDRYFNGELLPEFPVLIRAISIYSLPKDFFSKPIFFDPENNDFSYPPWDRDDVRFAVLNLTSNRELILNYDNEAEFYSKVCYKTAEGLEKISTLLDKPELSAEQREIISIRYYKIYEWLHIIKSHFNKTELANYFINELFLRDWCSINPVSNITRAIVEVIDTIEISSDKLIKVRYTYEPIFNGEYLNDYVYDNKKFIMVEKT